MTTLISVDTAMAGARPPTSNLRSVQLVGVASGLGAPDPRCADGPLHLFAGGLSARLAAGGIENTVRAMLRADCTPSWSRHHALARLSSRLAGEVAISIASGAFPVVLGGDHSCAIGTWSGVARATSARGPVGLVWIDAHMDSHTPATSHSNRLHGMPLAALLGHGGRRNVPSAMATLVADPPLSAAHTCLVGVRSYEREEAALLSHLGVRVIGMAEIAVRGLAAVVSDAIRTASGAEAGYGISIDLDAIDPADAPGVGSPVPGGIRGAALLDALAPCATDPRLLALEVAEYLPHRDVAGRTSALIEALLSVVLGAGLRAVERSSAIAGA